MNISALEQRAIEYVIGKGGGAGNEGGFSNNANDHGGATFSGFTLTTVRRLSAQIHGVDFDKDKDGDIDAEDLKKMTYEDLLAMADTYWNKNLDYVAFPVVAIKTYDFCFNCGERSGVKLLQIAVNEALGKQAVAVDGVIGPRTVSAVNACTEDILTKRLIAAAKDHYRAIVVHDSTQAEFLSGWLHRAERLPE